eukprot:360539-Chlamydomonas_euryale.AAC.3
MVAAAAAVTRSVYSAVGHCCHAHKAPISPCSPPPPHTHILSTRRSPPQMRGPFCLYSALPAPPVFTPHCSRFQQGVLSTRTQHHKHRPSSPRTAHTSDKGSSPRTAHTSKEGSTRTTHCPPFPSTACTSNRRSNKPTLPALPAFPPTVSAFTQHCPHFQGGVNPHPALPALPAFPPTVSAFTPHCTTQHLLGRPSACVPLPRHHRPSCPVASPTT